jgi:hypothetical protein
LSMAMLVATSASPCFEFTGEVMNLGFCDKKVLVHRGSDEFVFCDKKGLWSTYLRYFLNHLGLLDRESVVGCSPNIHL